MKKTFYIFLISLFHLFSVNLLAQPSTPYAPNFEATDINGIPYDIHAILDEGKTIVLEFFTVNSPVSLNSREAMNILQDTYGTEGDFSMVYLGIEMDTVNGGETQFISDYNITYPIIDDLAPMGTLYGADINTPMFIIICPDRLWKVRYGSIFDDTSFILTLTDQCEELSEHEMDGKIFSYFGEEEYCDGNLKSELYIQNYSDSIYLTSAVITAWEGNDLKGSTSWTGYVEPYTIDTVEFDLSDIEEFTEITFRLDSVNNLPDTNLENNTFTMNFEEAPASGTNMTVTVSTDFKPEETTWFIEDPFGDIIYESLQYWPISTNVFDLNFLIEGCYRFIIEDTFGDGIENGIFDGEEYGFVHVVNHLGDTIFNENEFEAGTSQRFYVDYHLSTEELNMPNFEVYPNPSSGIVNIVLDEKSHFGRLTIHSVLGNLIYQKEVQTQSVHQLNTEAWSKGIYFIQIESENNTHSKKLIIK